MAGVHYDIGDSQVIKALDFDPDTGELVVTLAKGRQYTLPNRTEQDVQAFLDSPSKGAFWNALIRK